MCSFKWFPYSILAPRFSTWPSHSVYLAG
jgi:hypothetical protein